ncbi:MAG TPA: phosphoribosylformylglycinamidine synthase, partial [bacterium (Candidatus Stahlbacteria)]|nr:phosphoribosylformylglycinamidine synthase [Candidatus Stahlbacteria bacterium]
AVGADPDRVALLDNFCFGSPEREDVMGSIVLACQACYDIALTYKTPFISGKDSLYNEYIDPDGNPRPILPTLLVSSLGFLDVKDVVTMDLKDEDNLIYLIGITREELGGSEYYYQMGIEDGFVPGLDPEVGMKVYKDLNKAIREGIIRSCHDLSEGGLGTAIAEMVIAGRIGATIDITSIGYEGQRRPDLILFSESNSRFLLEVDPRDEDQLLKLLRDLPIFKIGKTGGDRLDIKFNHQTVLSIPISTLEKTWKRKPI